MADPDRELLDEVLVGTQAMANLAKDDETFRAVVDAFRAQDGESMHLLLERHKLAERCEVICHWLRSKESVLLCLELAGPPPLEEREGPDIREFAQIAAKVSADEELVELMAQAVQERDTSAWSELIDKNELQAFSHLLCHWVSTIHYRLVCDVVCQPVRVPRPHLIPELQTAGRALGMVLADENVFAAAVKGVRANSCETLSGALEDGGFGSFCFFICEFFCSWRCMLLCLRLCRVFPLAPIESQIGEMLDFARETGRIGSNRADLERISAAILREDDELVQKLVKKLRYEPYCLQFCHWVCFLRCQLFCFCVCPPRTIAVFTHIGGLAYNTAVDSHVTGSGLTLSDNRAFFSTLRLNGGLSVVDGAPLVEYHFQTIETAADGSPVGAWEAVTPAQIGATFIGQFIRPISLPPFFESVEVWVNNPGTSGLNITPDADGWIKVPPFHPVPPMVPVADADWRFVPREDLIAFSTTTLVPSVVTIDEAAIGNAGSTAVAPLQTDVHYGIRMRIRNQGSSGAGSEAGTCSHIAINNTIYDHVPHHPYWPGGLFGANHELAVSSLGIEQLRLAPCSLLLDTVTVKFTAAHSNLGPVAVTMEGPGGPYTFDLVPAAAQDPGENWFGDATPLLDGSSQPWDFSTLDPCAYLLKLSVTPLLTTGDGVPDPLVDYIAYCKGSTA